MKEPRAPGRSRIFRICLRAFRTPLFPYLALLVGCLSTDQEEPEADDGCQAGSATCVTRPSMVFNIEGRNPNYPAVTLEKPILIHPFVDPDSGLGLSITYNGLPYALSAVVRIYDALQLPFVSTAPKDSFAIDSANRVFLPLDSLSAALSTKMKPLEDSTYPFVLEIQNRNSLRAAWVFGWEWDAKTRELRYASGDSVEMRLTTGAFRGALELDSGSHAVDPDGVRASMIFIQGTRFFTRIRPLDTSFTLGYLPRGKYRVLLVNSPADSLPDWTDLDVLELVAASDTSTMETYFPGPKVGTIRIKGKL
jgi:hypothetical protein